MGTMLRLQHTSVPMWPGGDDEARHFYGTVMNMPEKPAPSTIVSQGLIWFWAGNDEIHVFREENLNHKAVGQHFCLQVDDLDWYRERCKSFGVAVEDNLEVVNRPRFYVHDPFGNRIEVVQVLGAYKEEHDPVQ